MMLFDPRFSFLVQYRRVKERCSRLPHRGLASGPHCRRNAVPQALWILPLPGKNAVRTPWVYEMREPVYYIVSQHIYEKAGVDLHEIWGWIHLVITYCGQLIRSWVSQIEVLSFSVFVLCVDETERYLSEWTLRWISNDLEARGHLKLSNFVVFSSKFCRNGWPDRFFETDAGITSW